MTFILEHWLLKTSIYDSINIDLDKHQNDHEYELPIEEKELQNISVLQNISLLSFEQKL